MTIDIRVSIIIPTKNPGDTIKACLESIKQQTYANIESIVVDNHSNDQTVEIANELADQVIIAGPERSAQRNIGVKASSGEYVLIVDSDMILRPEVVDACVSVVKSENSVGAIIIPEVSIGQGFWAACKALERSCYVGDNDIEAARFYEKHTFLRLGGFDEELNAGEDWDLSIRFRDTGRNIERIEANIEHMEGHLSLFDTAKKKAYYGRSIIAYLNKHPEKVKRQVSPIRSAFLKHWQLLIRHPVQTTGIFVMKFVEGCAFLFGICASRSRQKRNAENKT